MARLDTERQQELEPKRFEYAQKQIESTGIEIQYTDEHKLAFLYNGHIVTFYPYSGWHTGKSIKDGRGLENLLKQLKANDQLPSVDTNNSRPKI